MHTPTSEQIKDFICGYLDIDRDSFDVIRYMIRNLDMIECQEEAELKNAMKIQEGRMISNVGYDMDAGITD